MIGDSPLEIDENDDFYINGIRNRGTPGLYEYLLIKDLIEDYKEQDLTAYKGILLATNAHKHSYLSGAKISNSKSNKYKTIISTLFPPKRGRGHESYMKFIPCAAIDYVHWDNPNELVERLKLLVVSKRAGHTGLDNEIVSIVEKLREAGIFINVKHCKHFVRNKMSVDKFGRHQSVLNVQRETKRTCVGFKITDNGNIDVENKKICNLKKPVAAKGSVSLAYKNNKIKDLKRYTKSELHKIMSVFRFHVKKFTLE